MAIGERQTAAKDLGARIDEIDNKIHDLLMRRAKLSLPAASPSRVTAALRRIGERHKGDMRLAAVLRIYQEIFAAAVPRRTIHFYDGEQAAFFQDLARDYFGSTAELVGHGSATAIIQACADDAASVGVVPPPQSSEDARIWWTQLAPAGHPGPRVVAKLPFALAPTASIEAPWAYAIGVGELEATASDTTVLLLEAAADLSRAKLQTLLRQAGLETHLLAVSRDGLKSALRQHLLETAGFVAPDDARLRLLLEYAGEAIIRVAPVGAFANPMAQIGSLR